MKRISLLIFLIFSISHTVMGQEDNQMKVPIEKIKVFPNPATTVVSVLGLQNSMRSEIIISDVYGNVVQAYQWEIRNNAISIPVSALDSGVYMITVTSPEQLVKTKFYKQ